MNNCLSRSNLHNYQVNAANYIKDKKRCALFLGLGLGKTTTTLTTIADLTADFTILRTLIIAPLRVCNSVWKQEAAKWDHTKHLKVNVCTGSTKERKEAFADDADIYVINRENIKWLVDNIDWKFDAVIIDESSSFKSYKSQRFKALKSVNHLTNYMVLLTATPASNGYMDLWSQMFLIDNGVALGKNITAYRNRFFSKYGFTYKLNKGAEEVIQERIKPFALSMTSDDYLELPPCLYLYNESHMTDDMFNEYESFAKTLVLEHSDGEITAMNSAVLTGKLQQYTQGAIYNEDGTTYREIHDIKIDALKELQEANAGENLLVTYNFKSDLERLVKVFPDAVVLDKDANTIKRWNNGKIKMLLAHPACLHGDTEVLTEHRGWVKITEVTMGDRVHDGVEFVSHSGCHYSGLKKVINKFGITLTENHKLLVGGNWIEAKDVRNSRNSKRKAYYGYKGNGTCISEMSNMWSFKETYKAGYGQIEQTLSKTLLDMYSGHISQYDKKPDMESVERYPCKVQKYIEKGRTLCESWGMQGMGMFQNFLQGYGRIISRTFNNRQDRQRVRLQQRELQVGYQYGATAKQKKQQGVGIQREGGYFTTTLQRRWDFKGGTYTSFKFRNVGRKCDIRLQPIELQKGEKIEKVYDLVNCGKRNRFLIRNDCGEVFVSHNSAGHGLNLQKGGSVIVWFGLNHSLELYEQFNGRLYRQGQDKPVRIVHLVIAGTIDYKILGALKNKAHVQNELINYFKDFIK